jgi:hypothetical protein
MLKASNIHYEMAPRVQGINCGGIGALHLMVQRLGLVEDLDRHLQRLKVHLPYHESDHVLNIAHNILVGGERLEDIELRRQDENFLNGLGAERIPDPTTAGDFTRRFGEQDIVSMQECINRARLERKVIAAPFHLEDQAGPVAQLLEKYRDQDMQLADACLVRMSELHRNCRAFTLDRQDFKLYRRFERQVIPLVAPD